MTGQALRAAISAAAFAMGGMVLVAGIPLVTGVSWSVVCARLVSVGWPILLGLTAIWLFGLWVYTFVLTASLPGLTRGQAFTLNAVGSAVSNLVPLGGGIGAGTTIMLTRRWGLPADAVATSLVVTGVWNAVAGIALPAAGLTVLAVLGDGSERWATGAVALLLWLAAAAVVAAAGSATVGARAAAAAERVARALPPAWRPEPARYADLVGSVRRGGLAAARGNWPTLTAALLGYVAMQGALFACCLAATGASTDPLPTTAAFLIGRALSLVVVLPGGSGISETGTIAVLLAHESDPTSAGAGVLLFTTFVFLLEIPLGGIVAMTSGGRRRFPKRSNRPAMWNERTSEPPYESRCGTDNYSHHSR